MRVNPKAILALVGAEAILKQTRGVGGKKTPASERGPRLLAASTAVLAAGGLLYLWRRGQRSSQAAFEAGAQLSGGDGTVGTVEETVVVVEESESEPAPETMRANGQEAAPPSAAGGFGTSEPEASTAPDESPPTTSQPEVSAGGASDVIASPEAVVDPDAAPDPIVSPEPALPRETGGPDS